MRLLLALAALPLFAPVLPAAPTPAPALASAVQLDLKGEIDRAIRWMRSQQRPDGSYGGEIEATARVLRAMAVSPRDYRRGDGPYVDGALEWLERRQQPDGAIHVEGAEGEAALRQTSLAAAALALYAEGAKGDALSRALGFLGKQQDGDLAPWGDDPLPEDPTAAQRRAEELLAARGSDPAWSEPDGGPSVLATARATAELARLARVLDSGSKGAAKPVTRLPSFEPARRAEALEAQRRGAEYLAQAAGDGLWGPGGQPDLGLTAMATGALLSVPEPRSEAVQAAIERGLAHLREHQHEDGSIHDGKVQSYSTSAAILALAAGGRAQDRERIVRAREFLVGLQADEGEGYSEGDRWYGGIGYGGDERPDLSNLQMALEALATSGLESDHAAFQRAIKFLERCQNRSESNDIAIQDGDVVIVAGDDGGSAYAPGDSPAGTIELGDGKVVARSYGSMTYALLKSYVLAGLERDDPRVEAAWEWIRENYTLDINPGFEHLDDPAAAYQGLYYYFLTMARTFDVLGTETIEDAEGREHHWRPELSGRLVALQDKTDGSWKNANSPRWWEANPTLATSYALLTLGAALPTDSASDGADEGGQGAGGGQ